MITLEIFLLCLLAVSIFTGLTTEAVKKVFVELKINYHANVLAGLVSLILSAAVGIGYICWTNIDFTSQNIIFIVALTFLSWLCAMVGYDKVIQAISQFKTHRGD